jgi:hypothetical protein
MVSAQHAALNLDGTSDGVHDAAKFNEDTVSSGVGDVATMSLDRRIQELTPVDPRSGERTYLVGTNQPAVSSHIGSEDSREVPFNSALFQGELQVPKGKSWAVRLAQTSAAGLLVSPSRTNRAMSPKSAIGRKRTRVGAT